MILYQQCSIICAGNDYKVQSNQWPAYMWSVLSDETARKWYGEMLWQLVLSSWCPWWIAAIKAELPELSAVSLEWPKPFFHE